MANSDQILLELAGNLGAEVTLVVGRTKDDEIEAQRLLLDASAADAFREQCASTASRIQDAAPTSYTATAELDDGQYFIIDDTQTLAEIADFRDFASNIGAIPPVPPSELDLTIAFYAVALGASDADRIVFVRRSNPSQRPRAGRFFAIGNERLRRLDDPSFAFASDFDFVLGSTWALVLNQKSFEMLFRDIGLVKKHIDAWITGITTHLPMSARDIDLLREAAIADSRMWRRLKEIQQRGHLADVNPEDVRKYAEAVDLDPDKVVLNGELVFDPADRFGFLHLLNEDLYKGSLTDQIFEAQRKSSTD